jgi:hypothetical protein
MKNLQLFIILTALVTGIAYLWLSFQPQAKVNAPTTQIEYEWIDASVDHLEDEIEALPTQVNVKKKASNQIPTKEIDDQGLDQPQDMDVRKELLKFEMGEYELTLKGNLWKMKVKPVIYTYYPMTLQTLRSSIENLRRILYFLGAHRVIEGVQSEGGIDRFVKDYQDRVTNVIKVGKIDRVEFENVQIYENPNPVPIAPNAHQGQVNDQPIRVAPQEE